ncbi:MAG: M23 family metallopeptidase [Chloroflexota bacterium]|nr:M23 family metallopeptidase [Chloroflexota bacterium]
MTYFQRLQTQVQQTLSDQIVPVRLAGHLSVLAVAAVILGLSQMTLPDWNISLASLSTNVLQGTGADTKQNVGAPAGTVTIANESASLQPSVIPFTLKTETPTQNVANSVSIPVIPRQDIEVYTVKPGDTVIDIAYRFGLQPETIMWANSEIEQDPDSLSIGDPLNILPTNGVLHIARPGDTLSSLAAKYKVSVADIVGYPGNSLIDAGKIAVGTQLIVPGGSKDFVTPQYAATVSGAAPEDGLKGVGSFSWPVGGQVSQQYWRGHPAVDISSWTGNPVKAADSGHVVSVTSGGWGGGYGNHVIIDHGNGFVSLYAHMSSIFVRQGENVSRSDQIGLVGNTGNSTGPHLHFEIRYQGVQRNPASYLP